MTLPTVVGTRTTATAIDGNNVTINLPTGTAQDDWAIVLLGVTNTAAGAEVPAGSPLWTLLETQDNTQIRGRVYAMLQGATPETSVTFSGTGVATDAINAQCWSIRGADLTTLLDVAIAKASGNTTDPDPAGLTTVTNDCLIIAMAVSNANEGSITTPTGYGTILQSLATDTNRVSAASASKGLATAGAENPGTFGSWALGRWCAFTLAIRPPTSANKTIDIANEGITLAEQAVGTVHAYVTTIENEAITLAETPVSFVYGHAIAIGNKALVLAETAVTLRHAFTTTIGNEALTLAKQAVGLVYGHRVTIGNEGLALLETAVTLRKASVVAIANEPMLFSETAVTLTKTAVGTYSIVIGNEPIVLSKTAVGFVRAWRAVIANEAMTFTETPVTLTKAAVPAPTLPGGGGGKGAKEFWQSPPKKKRKKREHPDALPVMVTAPPTIAAPTATPVPAIDQRELDELLTTGTPELRAIKAKAKAETKAAIKELAERRRRDDEDVIMLAMTI